MKEEQFEKIIGKLDEILAVLSRIVLTPAIPPPTSLPPHAPYPRPSVIPGTFPRPVPAPYSGYNCFFCKRWIRNGENHQCSSTIRGSSSGTYTTCGYATGAGTCYLSKGHYGACLGATVMNRDQAG